MSGLKPTLPAGTDLASLGVDPNAIAKVIEDNLSSVSGNLLQGIQNSLNEAISTSTTPFGTPPEP
jgi:hypothetical protein